MALAHPYRRLIAAYDGSGHAREGLALAQRPAGAVGAHHDLAEAEDALIVLGSSPTRLVRSAPCRVLVVPRESATLPAGE